MTSSARCQGDADSDVESTAEELEEEQRERNLTMFSKRHLFVELHELKNNEWHETKRYNYGLEEDLATDGPKRHWTKAHLPSISVFGMLAFRDCLHEDLVILDVASQSATGASQLEPVALAIVDHLPEVVERDSELKAFKREREQRKRRQTLESEVSKLPRAGPLETLGEVDEDGDDGGGEASGVVAAASLPAPRHGVRGSSAAKLLHDRHVEMGAAAAAMMQDDSVVRVAYEATAPSQVLAAIDRRLSALRVLPQTSRPTSKAVDRRAKRIMKQLAQLKEEEERKRLEALDAENDLVTGRAVGSVFLRVQYPTQNQKLLAKQRDVFAKGVSLTTFFEFAQKYALPLVVGIVLALVLANARAGGYRRWAGASHGGDDDDGDDGLVDDHGDDHGSSHGGHPTVFGLRVHGHDVTLHFLVNDVLMALFFGLAVKEIAEAFQPGGSLYPPGRKAVNPLCGTRRRPRPHRGVLRRALRGDGVGPADGLRLRAVRPGLGHPTATDISVAWVAAICVFAGHVAINYLLLCAVIDDGLGLVIIAVAYPDPDAPRRPRGGGELGAVLSSRRGVSDANLKAHDSAMEAGAEPEAHVPVHRSPLHDFEESVKGFVDFGVLFAFVVSGRARRRGRRLHGRHLPELALGQGPGHDPGLEPGDGPGLRPGGMSHRHLVVAGVISSVGLTVSLFIAGEAFTAKPTLEAQAKMGALLSVFPPLVLCGAAVADPRMRDRLLGPDGKKDDDATLEGGSNRSGGTLPTDDDASSAASTAGDPPRWPSRRARTSRPSS
ncbi:Na+/H+ antiporter 1 [Aureococcus anophagefferens]|nr:Na+/H+ antiporter 1 [Aureococcus anophagefferens]